MPVAGRLTVIRCRLANVSFHGMTDGRSVVNVSIKVTVRFVASLRDVAGTDKAVIELPEDITVGELLRKLESRWPKLRDFARTISGWGESIAVLLNGRETSLTDKVRDGDEVVLLPPASGGVNP
ncbi:MAG: MoaD/ThiS family protein [Thermoproteota archaeon]